MKNKLIFFIFLFIFTQQLFSSTVIIDKEYKPAIFNMNLKNIPEIYTYTDIVNALNKQYDYLLTTTIPEIEGNKRYFKDNKKKIGDFITQICDTFDAVAQVSKKKGVIKLTQLYSTFAKFPYGWNVADTAHTLQLNYPNISFKIDGNRIYAYGTEKQINEVSPVMKNLEYSTNKKIKFVVQIYSYPTTEQDDEFLGYKKDKLSFKGEKLLLQNVVYLKHNEIVGIQFLDNMVTVKLDLIKEELIFNNIYKLPLSDIGEAGFVFTENKDKDNMWDLKKGKRRYIIEMKYADL